MACLKFNNGNKIVFFVMLIILIFSLSVFAQEKENNVAPYYPKDVSQAQEYIGEGGIKNFLKQEDYFSILLAFEAARKKDISVCKDSGQFRDCKEEAENIILIRNMAEGNCGRINDETFAQICRSLKENDCSNLSGWRRNICSGLLNEDFGAVKEVLRNAEYRREQGANEFDLMAMMAVFLGFKHYHSKMACEKYGLDLPLPKKFICDVLFNTEGADKVIDSIVGDLNTFIRAKDQNNPTLCNGIKDEDIKAKCINPKIKTVKSIW